jgi:hypothetical protein
MAPLFVSCAAELSVVVPAVSVGLEEVLAVLSDALLLLSVLVLVSVTPVALVAVEAGVVDSALDVVAAVLVELELPGRLGRSNSTPYAMQIALEPSAVTSDSSQYIAIEYYVQISTTAAQGLNNSILWSGSIPGLLHRL